MQLSFTIDNTPLLLDENTSVQLVYYNPFFAIRDFPGDKGVNIEIPVNSYNRAMLGNPAIFDKKRDTNDREFTGFAITFGGWEAMSGTLIIQSANETSYSGWLRTSAGNLGKDERERYINENDIFKSLKQFENKTSYIPGTDDYCCPIVYNTRFFEDIGKKILHDDEWVSLLAYNFKRTVGNSVNARNTDGSIKAVSDTENVITNPTELDVFAVTPMLFVNYTLETILKSSGLYIENNYLDTDWRFRNLSIYNNFDITAMMYGLSSASWLTFNWFNVNVQKATAKNFDTIMRYYTGYFKYSQLLPKISLKDFILSIQNISNTCMHFKARNKVDILDREEILTGTPDNIADYIVDVWEIGEQKDITLKFTFTPDDDDNVISEQFENLDDRRDDIGESVDDWTDLEAIASPKFGEIRYINNSRIYAEYKWVQKVEIAANGEEETTDMLGWEHISLGFQNGFYNEGKDEEEEIPTKLSPFPQNIQVEQKGNMESMKYDSNDFGFRLISNVGNLFGNLEWEGETGLINTRWKNTAKFLSSRLDVNGKAQLPINVLDWVIRRLPYKKRAAEGEFIIEEMNVTLNSNSISPVNFKGYKI